MQSSINIIKMDIVITTIAILSALGAASALILYYVAQKFKVFEDPRIDDIEAVLPAANCGGCGFPGCRAFAEGLTKADDISTMNCPVGGAEVMKQAAAIIGKEAKAAIPMVAVLRCSGSCDVRPTTNRYDGATSCTVAAALYGGETDCTYGCLGLGECVAACQFNAMYMDVETGLPVIDEVACIACGACVRACPKKIIEMRKKGPDGHRIYVSCANKDKGAAAKKACNVACIGCEKCAKVCPHEAITITQNLAYITDNKCQLCQKCIDVCPTQAIVEKNFSMATEKAS